MEGFAIPEPFSPKVNRFQTKTEVTLNKMFAQNDLQSIYKSYLDKFPDKGVKMFPSFMSGKNVKVY